MKKFFLLLVIITAFAISCKKNSGDIIISQNIHGQVYNLCTDSGMANITVYLQENGSNVAQMISDANGNFSFVNAQVHSSNTYTYSLYIPSKSGIGGGPEIGFDGGTWDLNKSRLTIQFVLGVVPKAADWLFYIPYNANPTDTFLLTMQQNTYRKNAPNAVWLLHGSGPPPPINGYIGTLDGYCMGWWQQTTDRIKNGLHIIKTDNIYVGYGATVTDTIPW